MSLSSHFYPPCLLLVSEENKAVPVQVLVLRLVPVQVAAHTLVLTVPCPHFHVLQVRPPPVLPPVPGGALLACLGQSGFPL